MVRCCRWLLAAALAAAAGAAPSLRGAELAQQVVVFDAGSSGTRVHVFNLSPVSLRGQKHVPDVDLARRDEQTKKVEPGLSSFARSGDVAGLRAHLLELLAFAGNFVPEARRSSTPVVLKATAGLRAVEAPQAMAALEGVRDTLATSGYRFQREWANIIQGREEGGLAWVAANFLHGTFDGGVAAEAPSLGIVEMGGGSMQVAFEVDQVDPIDDSDDFVFETALGRTYRLYAHSYQSYGQDYARARLQELVPAEEDEDPCYAPGYERPSGSGGIVRGAGDGDRCRENIEAILLGPVGDAPGTYSHELPLRGDSFVAVGSFWYTQDDLALSLEDRPLGPGDFEAAARAACQSAPGAGIEPQKASTLCFAMSYEAAALQALHPWGNGASVRIVHQIRGTEVDWALGAALVHFLRGQRALVSAGRHSATLLDAVGSVITLASVAMAIWSCGRFVQPSQVAKSMKSTLPTNIGLPAYVRVGQ